METTDIPEETGGLGSLLPAEVLQKLNELLNQQQVADRISHGSININIFKPGSQHVETQINIETHPHSLPIGRGVDTFKTEKTNHPALPDVLCTEKAMVLWQKAQRAGWIDDDYQPTISRTQAALLADEIAERLVIQEKWKVFETLWNRRNMYRDYHDALNQRQSLLFRDRIRELLG